MEQPTALIACRVCVLCVSVLAIPLIPWRPRRRNPTSSISWRTRWPLRCYPSMTRTRPSRHPTWTSWPRRASLSTLHIAIRLCAPPLGLSWSAANFRPRLVPMIMPPISLLTFRPMPTISVARAIIPLCPGRCTSVVRISCTDTRSV